MVKITKYGHNIRVTIDKDVANIVNFNPSDTVVVVPDDSLTYLKIKKIKNEQ